MPTPPDSPRNEFSAIDDLAAAWTARRDRGLTPAEQDEFLHWLGADPRHGERFARHQRGWNELAQLAQWRPEHAEPNPDILAPTPSSRKRNNIIRWALPLTLAAAAALAVALRPSAQHPVSRPVPVAPSEVAYRQQVLDDGSLVELNRGAQIDVAFTPGERRVRLLRGEALFTVAKNAARPFVVEAGGVQLRALGTAFNVRLETFVVQVLVTEGSVQVARPEHPLTDAPILVMRERAVVPRSAAEPIRETVTAEEIDRALLWQVRLLEFSSTPLAEVAEAFNRRNRMQLVIADPALAALPIGTSFRSDNVDGFVRLLEVSFGIAADRRENEILLRRAR